MNNAGGTQLDTTWGSDYMSSSQCDEDRYAGNVGKGVWYVHINNGQITDVTKHQTKYLRAVRAF